MGKKDKDGRADAHARFLQRRAAVIDKPASLEELARSRSGEEIKLMANFILAADTQTSQPCDLSPKIIQGFASGRFKDPSDDQRLAIVQTATAMGWKPPEIS